MESVFDPKGNAFVKAAGWAFLAQLACMAVATAAAFAFGAAPETAAEYFRSLDQGFVRTLLRDDFASVMVIVLYMFTFTGLFVILKDRRPLASFVALAGALMAVVLTIASHPGFSMLRLHEASLAHPGMEQAFLAAGEALIAKNMWHDTGGFFSGIFLQGGGILMSVAMVSDRRFWRLGWISGLAANGLDLMNHLLHYGNPGLAGTLLMAAGPFYLVWTVAMAANLFRLASGKK